LTVTSLVKRYLHCHHFDPLALLSIFISQTPCIAVCRHIPGPSQPLPGTISHNSLLPTHHSSSPPIPIPSLQTEGPISHSQLSYPLRTLPGTAPSSSDRPTCPIQNDLAEGAHSNDTPSPYALPEIGGNSSALRTPEDPGLSQP
jgi:hypothetical protein